MKRLFTTFSLSAIFLFGAINSSAQNNRSTNPVLPYNGEMCGSAYIHNDLMKNDPAYRARFTANEQKIEAIIANQKAGRYGQNSVMSTVYTIPVVVHVIHLGESVGVGTNISDAQIQSAIDNLNTAYRNQSPYNGVDIEVQFALAQRDPNCNATTGINRVSGAGVSDYSTNGCTRSGSSNETTIKALSKWPNSSYYNIWVVAGIDGNMGGGGIQGYAYFPGAGSSVDGAVMLYNAFGYDPTGTLGYNLKSYTNHNGTAIHELGHAFNLYHTFEGDDANGDGTADQCPTSSGCGSGAGDCCADTPPHKRSNSDCNSSGTNSCDGNSSNSLFVHNFMDYSSDACKYQFTSDQKTRMRAAIDASRGSLINSLATTAPSGSSPASACTVTTTTIDGDYPIGVYRFTFNDLDVGSGSSYEDAANGYVDRTCYFRTTVTAGTAYSATVNTGTSYNHNTKIFIDYNNDGDFADAGETVFSTSNLMTTHTGTINIPSSPPVTGTPLRMRVMADYAGYTIGSCTNPGYGQAEDFAITITAAAGSPPVTNFSGSPTTLCVGGSVTYTDASTNSPTSWTWTFQGGSPATSSLQNPVVTYTAAGTYSVSLTASNGSGSNTMDKTSYITVNGKPTVTANATANPICSGSSTTLTGGGATTYTWTGGVTNGVSFIPSSTSSYTVTGTDGNGCVNTAAITVSVTATPTVSVSGTMTITTGSSTTLTASNATTYSWSPSTGLSATSGATVVANPTTTTVYTVTGTTGSCPGSKTFTITVNAVVGPTNLQPAYCGITLSAMNQQMFCAPVSGSGYYKYEVTNLSNNSVAYYQSPNSSTAFQMSWVSGIAYNTTYQVRVAAYLSGSWSAYGTACNVTTPSTASTKLQTAYCGITLTALNQQMACDGVYGATNYRYEITDLSNNSIVYYTSPNASTLFQMSWVSGVAYGKTYAIRVAALAGGSQLAYGVSCNVTTPSAPTTKLQNAYCGVTISAMNQALACDALYGATQYKYEITDLSNNSILYYTSPNSSTAFQMLWVSGVQYAKTYAIRVAAYAGGSLMAYGASCNVTTPATPTTQLQPSDCNISEASFAQTLHCVMVQGATQYLYEVTDASNNNVYYYQSPANGSTAFQMNWVSGVTTSKTYQVRVAAYVGGTQLSYGSSCGVTTAASFMLDAGDAAEAEGVGQARMIASEGSISMNVYPNPNDGHVYLNVNKDMKVTVTNVLGEKMYEGDVKNGVNELYFLDAKPGMYIIRVSDGEDATQVRMIKN